MFEIKKNGVYRVVGRPKYFGKKYGMPNPEIKIEGTDVDVFGCHWQINEGNPACELFYMSSMNEDHVNFLMSAFYGHMVKSGLGELVWADELDLI